MPRIKKMDIEVKMIKRFRVNGIQTRYNTIMPVAPVNNTHIVDISSGVSGMSKDRILT